jgi:hypothetical protein
LDLNIFLGISYIPFPSLRDGCLADSPSARLAKRQEADATREIPHNQKEVKIDEPLVEIDVETPFKNKCRLWKERTEAKNALEKEQAILRRKENERMYLISDPPPVPDMTPEEERTLMFNEHRENVAKLIERNKNKWGVNTKLGEIPKILKEGKKKKEYDSEAVRAKLREIERLDQLSIPPEQRRIDNITTIYPNYQEVLDREECSLEEIQWRMLANPEYDPFEKDQWWNPTVHQAYALLEEEERDALFMQALEDQCGKPWRYTRGQRTMFKNTRIRADSVKALYSGFIIAQIYKYDNLSDYPNICAKKGVENYNEWVEMGRPTLSWGANTAYSRKVLFKNGRVPKYRRKSEEQKWKEHRELLGKEVKKGYNHPNVLHMSDYK